jgi:hypothetical protein
VLLINSIIGASLLISFLGFMAFWLKEPPLIIIMLLVVGLMIYDIWKEIRASRGNDA